MDSELVIEMLREENHYDDGFQARINRVQDFLRAIELKLNEDNWKRKDVRGGQVELLDVYLGGKVYLKLVRFTDESGTIFEPTEEWLMLALWAADRVFIPGAGRKSRVHRVVCDCYGGTLKVRNIDPTAAVPMATHFGYKPRGSYWCDYQSPTKQYGWTFRVVIDRRSLPGRYTSPF